MSQCYGEEHRLCLYKPATELAKRGIEHDILYSASQALLTGKPVAEHVVELLHVAVSVVSHKSHRLGKPLTVVISASLAFCSLNRVPATG